MVSAVVGTLAALGCAGTPSTGTATPDPCSGLCTCPDISPADCCSMGCDLIQTAAGMRCADGTHTSGELSGGVCVYGDSGTGG